MATNRFEVDGGRPGVSVIKLRGQIDSLAEAALESAYAEAIEPGPDSVLLDFEEVDYINSTGIALIVGVLAKARKDRVAVAASGLTDHYREIFEITRLADFMTIFPDAGTAVGDGPASDLTATTNETERR
jgi:anti-sigma B factor antagonist